MMYRCMMLMHIHTREESYMKADRDAAVRSVLRFIHMARRARTIDGDTKTIARIAPPPYGNTPVRFSSQWQLAPREGDGVYAWRRLWGIPHRVIFYFSVFHCFEFKTKQSETEHPRTYCTVRTRTLCHIATKR